MRSAQPRTLFPVVRANTFDKHTATARKFALFNRGFPRYSAAFVGGHPWRLPFNILENTHGW